MARTINKKYYPINRLWTPIMPIVNVYHPNDIEACWYYILNEIYSQTLRCVYRWRKYSCEERSSQFSIGLCSRLLSGNLGINQVTITIMKFYIKLIAASRVIRFALQKMVMMHLKLSTSICLAPVPTNLHFFILFFLIQKKNRKNCVTS